jgi:hypothetical protein
MDISKFTYKVTFNNGDFGVGDEHETSIDFIGNDVAELAAEVIASDPSFPMRFIPGQHPSIFDEVVGVFVEVGVDPEDESPTAVMYC